MLSSIKYYCSVPSPFQNVQFLVHTTSYLLLLGPILSLTFMSLFICIPVLCCARTLFSMRFASCTYACCVVYVCVLCCVPMHVGLCLCILCCVCIRVVGVCMHVVFCLYACSVVSVCMLCMLCCFRMRVVSVCVLCCVRMRVSYVRMCVVLVPYTCCVVSL